MRPIKFRFWDTVDKGWCSDTNFAIKGDGTIKAFGGVQFMPESNVVASQYTGLLDKNGKEIYEGDILKCERDYWGEPRNLIVEWNDERYSLRNPKDHVDSEVMDGTSSFDVPERKREVIGNIYENPELIK